MAFFIVGLLIALIYVIISNVVPMLWKFFKYTHWSKIRISDYRKVFSALLFISVIEYNFPTFGATGREEISIVDQTQNINEMVAWPKNPPNLSELSETSSWLYPFSKKADTERNQKLQALIDEIKTIEASVSIKQKRYNEARNAYQKYQADNRGDNSNIIQKKLKAFEQKYLVIEKELSELDSRKAKANNQRIKLLEEILLFSDNDDITQFEQPIALIDQAKSFSYKEVKPIDKIKQPVSADGDTAVVGPAKAGLFNIASERFKHTYGALKGSNRPEVKGLNSLSCYMTINKDNKGKRFCEVSHPLPLNYDLVNSNCLAPDVMHVGESAVICLERWNIPQFNIRIFEDKIIFFEPKALDKNFEFLDRSPNSQWEVIFEGKQYQLKGEVVIEFPTSIEDIGKVTLIHKPTAASIGVFSDIDIESDWLGNSAGFRDSSLVSKNFKFSDIGYEVNMSENLNFALQFVGQKKAEGREKNIDSKLGITLLALKQFGTQKKPRCKISNTALEPSIIENATLRTIYRSMNLLRMNESIKPDCNKVTTVYAIISSLKLALSIK